MIKNNSFRASLSALGAFPALMLVLWPWGCSPRETVSGATNWQRCDTDEECSAFPGALCGVDGYCVDAKGQPVEGSGGQRSSGGSSNAAGGTLSTGGVGVGGSVESSGGMAGSPAASGGMGGSATLGACEERSVEDCEATSDCFALSGQPLTAETCQTPIPSAVVGCFPADTGCTQSVKTAVSPEGKCYVFGSCVPLDFRIAQSGDCEGDALTPCPSAEVSPDQLNQACDANDMCPAGLTAVHFYGIAGPAGPEFCSCSIPCTEGVTVCPEGSSCGYIADGPGQVCIAR